MSSQDNQIPEVLCEFFEIVIHNILCRRGIYPKSIFVKTKAYGLPVYQSVHPELNEYISKCLKAVLFHLKNKTLRRIVLGINSGGITIERYVIVIYEINECLITDLYYLLECQFKHICLKIESSIENLEEVSSDACFYVNLEVTNHSAIIFSEQIEHTHFPWNTNDVNEEASEIIPIHLLESEEVKLHLFIEKNTATIKT